MPTRYDADDEDPDSGGGDREISLGTGTVLGIFLALALVCSLFFGLGYSMGRKSAPPQIAGAAATEPSGLAASGADKPSPGSPASSRSLKPDLQVSQPVDGDAEPTETASRSTSASSRSSTATPASHDHPPAPRSSTTGETTAPPPPVAMFGPQTFVQIAAVSRKEDADLLLAALRKRGYAGVIRPQTQDKLLHIQVGPFPTKKDAEAMRQRLIVDGYNPILK